MIFERSPGTITLRLAPLRTIQSYEQHSPTRPEAGGVLLGRLILNSNDVVVDVASEPCAEDRAGRTYFDRAAEPTQRLINEAWERSNGTSIFLGEWHTHPEARPTPSRIDRRNWKRVFKEATIEQDFLFFLIAGTETVRLWEYRKRCIHRLVECPQPAR